ncbi:MAG: hypothetical protein R2728_05375 [Chitinophagales bacterium]
MVELIDASEDNCDITSILINSYDRLPHKQLKAIQQVFFEFNNIPCYLQLYTIKYNANTYDFT